VTSGRFMHDPAYGLPRTALLGGWVNNPLSMLRYVGGEEPSLL
jgi:hypothetical protein